MDPSSHPEKQALLSWLSDQLEEKQAAEVSDHVGQCQSCADLTIAIRRHELLNSQTHAQGDSETQHAPGPRVTNQDVAFGVVAMESGLISQRHFVQACSLSETQQASVADVLIETQMLRPEDRKLINALLANRARQAATATADHTLTRSLGPSPTDETLPTGSTSAGMELLRLHAAGGIGQVWLARDRALDREVALKRLQADKASSPVAKERFEREATLTGQLEHPGIVPVYQYSAGSTASECFYTMRFLRGRTLTDVLADYHQGTLNHTENFPGLISVLNYFTAICHTMAFAHSRDVIHRDLKGDNVMIGEFGEVIVVDWGLAKELETPETNPRHPIALLKSPTATLPGDPLGTPSYMAPEQAHGRLDLVDKRSDVYGLAAILYEILTGYPPFCGGTVFNVLQRVQREAPVPPSELKDGVPPDLEAACLKGLSKLQEDRQQSAKEIGADVQSWIADQAARRQTEKELKRFFAMSLDLLGIMTPDGLIKQVNPAWEQALGWSLDELVGRNVDDLIHPDDDRNPEENTERILAGEAMTGLRRRLLCKNGSYRELDWHASLIEGESLIYIVGRLLNDPPEEPMARK